MSKKKKFKFIDLFAGIGGFKIGISNNGGECIGFSEINKDAVNTYCENFELSPELNFGDITQISELPSHDLLTGGVPCQSWSIAGRNLGFDDDRGQLWNDTIYLLQQSRPKAFIFENVKGLADPRNSEALSYILGRIKEAGYYASYYVINSFKYGVPQNRIRIYIIGFREEEFYNKFKLPPPSIKRITLGEILGIETTVKENDLPTQKDLFGGTVQTRSMSLSNKNGFNDYFLFNDIRNGNTTVHSWDLIDTTERQKDICLLLLRNRRKSAYGKLDGNPLSYEHLRNLDSSIEQQEIDDLVDHSIFRDEEYRFEIIGSTDEDITEEEKEVLSRNKNKFIILDEIVTDRFFKVNKISVSDTIEKLKSRGLIQCVEIRYDFRNTRISTGLNGINRIFLPSSDIYSTLVASDTHDYIATIQIEASSHEEYKKDFIDEIYKEGNYRKITKGEACLIQGFPEDFKLPESRSRWMKLLGNSVTVPVIDNLVKAIVRTGVFD